MLHELADLLLGASCPGCGLPRLGLCPGCSRELDTPVRRVVDAPALGGMEVWAAAGYRGCLVALLSAHKDRGALWLTPVLAQRLAMALVVLLEDEDPATRWVLVPVPSSARAVRERGFDHATALARGASRRLTRAGPHRVVTSAVLRRGRRVVDQTALGRAARQRNQLGSQVARRGPRPGEVAVLVDDICTTGASLAEARRALRAAGWPVLGGAVVAHPQHPGAGLSQTA